MARRKDEDVPEPRPARARRATTPEAREAQLINLALDQIEIELREQRASSQVLSHYAKLASSRERLEQERLHMEIDLGHQKRESMAAADRMEQRLEEALQVFSGYVMDTSEIPPDLEFDE